jgi:PAS domain S-box-containing protein
MRALSRFREAVIEQANVMVVVFSPEGRVLVWNRAAAQITGYSADEVMGQEAWDQLLEDEEEIAGVREMLDSMVREGADFTDVETRIRTADGERRLVSWHARRLADDQGNAMGAVAMGRDVTEQRELERKVERSARMEAIGRLAGGVAHDFNNMLTAIIGNAKLLEPELEDEHLRGQLTDIRDAGERSAALTRQLLTFSRQVPTEAMVFELNDVVEGMQSMLERLTKEHTRIEVDLAHEPTTVRADPAQMEQVLMNLAVNAETAMPDGGRLTIETSVEEVEGETMPEIGGAEYVVLRVSDTGCGMDEETLERAFEPFFTTRQEGTGLGLATVYGIVQESGGEIELQSTPGEGTTATVYLPRVDEAPEEIDPAPTAEGKSAEADAATQARVLLAEDEKQVRTLIAGILRSEGYEVLTAESGEAAREMYDQQEQPLDLVVTDVVMTGLSGTDLAEHIRADAPQLPVLFISGYSDLQLPRGARLLQKPFLPEDLMDAVRDVLDSSGD